MGFPVIDDVCCGVEVTLSASAVGYRRSMAIGAPGGGGAENPAAPLPPPPPPSSK